MDSASSLPNGVWEMDGARDAHASGWPNPDTVVQPGKTGRAGQMGKPLEANMNSLFPN